MPPLITPRQNRFIYTSRSGAQRFPWQRCTTILAGLYAKGLIRKVAVPGFPDRYDNVTRHDHLVCQNCGRLVDVSLEDFTESIQRDSGAQIISYDLNVTYLCPECTEARVGKDALHN